MSIGIAFRAFFAALFSKEKARHIQAAMQGSVSSGAQQAKPAITTADKSSASPKPKTAVKNDALILLSALQREARFIDLVNESLEEYSNEQVGAAARDVIRDCSKVLKRMFDVQPLVASQEGETTSLPENASADRWRVIGGTGNSGRLVHPGWQASKTDIPIWTGRKEDVLVLAAAEIES